MWSNIAKLSLAACLGVLIAGFAVFSDPDNKLERAAMPFASAFQSVVRIAQDPISDALYGQRDAAMQPLPPYQYQEYRDAPSERQAPARSVVPPYAKTRGRIMMDVVAPVLN